MKALSFNKVRAIGIASLMFCAWPRISEATIIVAFDLDVSVNFVSSDAKRSEITGQVVKSTRNRGNAPEFSDVSFESRAFNWKFLATSDGFGSAIRGNASAPTCFRFDQAVVSTSMNATAVPLRVFSARQGSQRSPAISVVANKSAAELPRPPKMCFKSGEYVEFFLRPDLSSVFPNKTMFNVAWLPGKPQLTETGVGQWLQLEIPVEIDGNYHITTIRMTAKNSKAWESYW